MLDRPSIISATLAARRGQVRRLLRALDPMRFSLPRWPMEVDTAVRIVLAHYRRQSAPAWLAPLAPDHASANAALNDRVRLQGVEAQLRRTPAGGIDWRWTGPRDDIEWALFQNRHMHLLPLIADPRAAAASRAGATIVDWVDANPRPRLIPREEWMRAAWRPMSAATRLLEVWPHGFFGRRLDDETMLVMLASIAEQADHVMRHHRRRHNHTIKEMTALFAASVLWPEFRRAGRWGDYARDKLAQELAAQFYPDGAHVELSAHYHRQALGYYALVADAADASGAPLDAEMRAGIARAARYLADVQSPLGTAPVNNDGDREWTAPMVARMLPDRPGADGSRFMPWAGQVAFRNGAVRQSSFAFFDIGPAGAAHQHNDRLNLTITSHGRELLSDGGRYRYVRTDPLVQHLRSGAGHNGLLIDGAGQRRGATHRHSPLNGRFAAGDLADFALGTIDQGFEGVKGRIGHHRAVLFAHAGFWLVVDRIVSDRPRDVTALWRFHPDATVRMAGGDVLSVDADLGNLRIAPIGVDWTVDLPRGVMEPEPMGWHSDRYNAIEPATVARFNARFGGDALFAWAMVPGRGMVPAPAIDVVEMDDTHVVLNIGHAGARYRAEIDMADEVERPPAETFGFSRIG